MTPRQATWTLGGLALIACGVIGILQSTVDLGPAAWWLAITNDALYAVALVLFAVGFTHAASLVERGPLGMTALIVLGAWPLTLTGLMLLFTYVIPLEANGWLLLSYVAIVVPTAAAVIGTLQIVRSGVAPGRWRWLPLWAFGLYAVAWAAPQLTSLTLGPAGVQGASPVFGGLALLAFVFGTIGLGLIALVLAAREKPAAAVPDETGGTPS